MEPGSSRVVRSGSRPIGSRPRVARGRRDAFGPPQRPTNAFDAASLSHDRSFADPEDDERRPVGWVLVATLAIVVGVAPIVGIVVWLMMNPYPSARALLVVPWMLVWYCIALAALRASRQPRSGRRR